MPSFEMTAAEEQQYGNSLNVWQALRLLQTWHPLVTYGQRFVQETDPYRKGLIFAEAGEWVASKTDTTIDDQLARLLGDLAKTKEAEAIVRWFLLQVEAIR
jgi:redox-sensitive bicupin YhaK (pirin superfamily)